MISSWAAWVLTIGAVGVLGVGLYLLAWHRGHTAGLADRFDAISGDPETHPPGYPFPPEPMVSPRRRLPSEDEFLSELIEHPRPPPESHRL
jgi:hypothetical protein